MTEKQQDVVMIRIGEAIGLAEAGDGTAARQRFAELWDEIGPGGDPFHRCVLAHYAADVQPDVRDELMWDLRALAAADEVTGERAQQHDGSLSMAGFAPSLHLNLADVYRRLGDHERARDHLGRAQDVVGALGDDGYGQMIREGIARAAARLAVDGSASDDSGRAG